MKTFEERYTAWIDGELEGNVLTAFEQELTRRAAVGEAAADKSDATRLRALLQDHLHAPALTNPDFSQPPAPGTHRRGNRGVIPWPRVPPPCGTDVLRVGAGPVDRSRCGEFVRSGGVVLRDDAGPCRAVAESYRCRQSFHRRKRRAGGRGRYARAFAPRLPAPRITRRLVWTTFVKRSPTPSPIDLTPDITTYVPDQPSNPTTITPLHYNKSNVNVLWLNGLDYMPSLPDTAGNVPLPAPSASANP